jgi:hypothetical protein
MPFLRMSIYSSMQLLLYRFLFRVPIKMVSKMVPVYTGSKKWFKMQLGSCQGSRGINVTNRMHCPDFSTAVKESVNREHYC